MSNKKRRCGLFLCQKSEADEFINFGEKHKSLDGWYGAGSLDPFLQLSLAVFEAKKEERE